MSQPHLTTLAGNRCGHDPQNPRLSPPTPIRNGPGGLPRILSLAAERAKEWFFHPGKCPALNSKPDRQTRSERREAIQIVLEVLLRHLDLASLQVGTPTLAQGFVDVGMATVVQETGLGQRRCERAIAQLKEAGFLRVQQPRFRNEEGKYFGLRAVRLFTAKFFDWLGLGPMLKKERDRASQALLKKARQGGKSLSDLVKRMGRVLKPFAARPQKPPMDKEKVRAWCSHIGQYFKAGMDHLEAQRRTNLELGYPPTWSPGQGAPTGW